MSDMECGWCCYEYNTYEYSICPRCNDPFEAGRLAGKAESAKEIAKLKEDVMHYITVGISRGMWAAAYKKSAKRWKARVQEVAESYRLLSQIEEDWDKIEERSKDRRIKAMETAQVDAAVIITRLVKRSMPGISTDVARKWLRDNGFRDPYLAYDDET